jgi:hypothetical protein
MFSSTKYDSFQKLTDSMKPGTTSSFKIQGTFDGKVHVIGSITFKPEDMIKKEISENGIDYSIKYIDIPIVLDKGMGMDLTATCKLFEFTNQSIDPSIAGLQIYNGKIGPDTKVSQRDFVPATKIYLTSNPSIGQSMGSMGQSIGSMYNKAASKIPSFGYGAPAPKRKEDSLNPNNEIDSFFKESTSNVQKPPSSQTSAPEGFKNIAEMGKQDNVKQYNPKRYGIFGGKTRRRGKTQKRKRPKKSIKARKTKSRK